MRDDLHKAMLEKIEKLRTLVGKASAETVCLKLFLLLGDTYKTAANQGLFSPFRQFQYALGLLLTTPEPVNHTELTEDEWKQVFRGLNDIYASYALMFWPAEDEQELSKTDAWFKPRSVAMPAFLHYFNQGSMASVEQTIAKIESTLVHFDSELAAATGLSATDAIKITNWICNDAQTRFNKLTAFLRYAKRHSEMAAKLGWDMVTAKLDAQSSPEYWDHMKALEDKRVPSTVFLSDLQAVFGSSTSAAYWSLFTARRGETSGFIYPTELNPAAHRPLIEFDDGKATMVVVNMLYEAALSTLTKTLTDDIEVRQRYFTRRDSALERQVSGCLRRMFPNAEHYSACYEQPDSHFEHDHVIIWQRAMFVVESKASPPPEPFRDPNKAFERIRRAFKSETGIQAAFNQANRLRKAILRGESIQLYNQSGELLREVTSAEIDAVYCICVTATSHGPVAVDLSMLLEKETDDHYPWAVNVNDLDNTVCAFVRKQWGPEKFREFLDQRQRLQGKAMTDDELEIVGAFVLYGTLEPWLSRPADKIFFQNGFSRLFDEIYEEQRGGPAPELEAKAPPRIDDVRSVLGSIDDNHLSKLDRLTSRSRLFLGDPPRRHVGRNDLCPCGSGQKFKRCCYRT
jgi:hypothetical protein